MELLDQQAILDKLVQQVIPVLQVRRGLQVSRVFLARLPIRVQQAPLAGLVKLDLLERRALLVKQALRAGRVKQDLLVSRAGRVKQATLAKQGPLVIQGSQDGLDILDTLVMALQALLVGLVDLGLLASQGSQGVQGGRVSQASQEIRVQLVARALLVLQGQQVYKALLEVAE